MGEYPWYLNPQEASGEEAAETAADEELDTEEAGVLMADPDTEAPSEEASSEGDENKNLEKYATTGSPEYDKMVSIIAERFGLSSLKFNTLETLIEAIGLPKCKVCTHCFDGSSHF